MKIQLELNYYNLKSQQNNLCKQLSNPRTIEVKNDQTIQVKEELNESTVCKAQKDYTPDPQAIKNNKNTTQFSISPHYNFMAQQNNNQVSIPNNNDIIPILSEQIQQGISPNPFSLVNFNGIINQQQQQISAPLINGLLKNQNLINQFTPYQSNNPFLNAPLDSLNQNNIQLQQYRDNSTESNTSSLLNALNIEQLLSKQQSNNLNDSFYQPSLYSSSSIENESMQSSFIQLLLYYQDMIKNSAQQSNTINMQNILSTNLLNYSDISEFNFSNLGRQIQTHNQSQLCSDLNRNISESSLQNSLLAQANTQFQQNQILNQNQNQNQFNNLCGSFQNVVKDINLNIFKNNLTSNLLQNLNQNPQYFLPISQSQVNIMKQQDIKHENINSKDQFKMGQQENQPRI